MHESSIARNAARGFSLLEVLVATVILAGAMAVILSGISSGQVAATQMERRTRAYHVAADLLNLAGAGEFASLPQSGQEQHRGVTYLWRIDSAGELKPLESTPWTSSQSNPRHLKCTVRWRTGGRTLSVTLERGMSASEQE